MKRLLAVLIFGPLAVLLVVLAVANRAPVRLSIDPFNPGSPALSVDLPLFFVGFGALALGVILGGVAVWLRQGRYRRSARREHREAVRWQREAEQARTAASPAGPALPAPDRRAA